MKYTQNIPKASQGVHFNDTSGTKVEIIFFSGT